MSDRPGHDRRYSIDPTLIRNELEWEPRHTFEQGLESTVRWFLENLDWCQAVQQGNGKQQRHQPTTGHFMRTVHHPPQVRAATRP